MLGETDNCLASQPVLFPTWFREMDDCLALTVNPATAIGTCQPVIIVRDNSAVTPCVIFNHRIMWMHDHVTTCWRARCRIFEVHAARVPVSMYSQLWTTRRNAKHQTMNKLLPIIFLSFFIGASSRELTAQDVRNSLHHEGRALMKVDFTSICADLRSIFNNRCNCGNAQQVQSGDSIECDNGQMTARAEFENFRITSMEICDRQPGGNVCSTIHYAQTIAVHCELAYNGNDCDSCFVCDADGLLGLRVNCDSTLPEVSTNGCEVASTYLHLHSAALNWTPFSAELILIVAGLMAWL